MGSFKNAFDPDHSARPAGTSPALSKLGRYYRDDSGSPARVSKKMICPHCHKQIVRPPGGKRGRPYTAYHEANGERKLMADWAALLKVTEPAIRYYLHKKKFTMQQVFDRLTDPNYKKPGPAQGHNWRKAAKEEYR